MQYTLTNSDLVNEIAHILKKYMGNNRPAATMIVANLIKQEMLVEIEITALKN